MPSPSLKQHLKERLSPRFCLRERGAVPFRVHRLVTMEQMYKSVFDSSNAPSPKLASYLLLILKHVFFHFQRLEKLKTDICALTGTRGLRITIAAL